jgi:uncharacterized protein YjaZ
MSIELHVLNAAGRLSRRNVRRIRRAFNVTASNVQKLLPIRNVDVVFQELPTLTLPETGIGGYSPSAELAFIYLNPWHKGFVTSIESEVAPMLAHELFHCTRWIGPGYGSTLGEALVSEGLALHFETLFRGRVPFYATAVGKPQLSALLEKARPAFTNNDYGHMAWFYGSPERDLPRYAGYSLAFQIVGEALAALDIHVKDAWSRPAADFLDIVVRQT